MGEQLPAAKIWNYQKGKKKKLLLDLMTTEDKAEHHKKAPLGTLKRLC